MLAPGIGLILGGGGARGVAHIAVLDALQDLGLKPTAIAGSSMGSIVGAGCAAGLDAQEIRERFIAAFGTRGNVFSRLWQLRPRSFSQLFGENSLALGKLDAERVIRVFVDDAFPESFADLKMPFVAVATDFYGGIEAHIASGPLLRAIAASCALPGIFRPVTIDGRVMVDGSILNPVPVDALPGRVDLTIAVDVVSFPEPRDGHAGPGAIESMMGSAQLMMQQIMMPKLERHPPDLLIRPPIGAFHVMDFLRTREILDACEPIREDIKRKLARLIEHPELRVIAPERTPLQLTGRAS
jgi:NTE family protein